MLGRFLRVLLALTAIAPLSISFAYIYAAKEHSYGYAFIAATSCVVLAVMSYWIIDKCRSELERLTIKIKKAKSADKEVIGFFVAYALPLIFRGQSAPDLDAWLMAGGMLLFVLWSTHSMQVNPVLGMFGFHFYEVETEDGITFLMITRRKINHVKSITTVVQISDYGILEANHLQGDRK